MRRHERNERGIGSLSHIATMRIRITGFGHHAAKRLLDPIVRPIVTNDLKPMVEQIVTNDLKPMIEQIVKNDLKPMVEQIVKDHLEQQAGGNPHTPHGGKARGLPVYTRLTKSDTSHNFFMAGTFLLCWISIWRKLRLDKRIEMEQKRTERESTKARKKNNDQMSDEWSAIAPSRMAVLNKTYKSNLFSDLLELLGMANKSKADQTTPAPESVDDVIQFFLWWKFYHDNKTINSDDLKERLGSEFDTFHDILKDISDDEARDWCDADSDNLNEVVDFLDGLSK